MQSSNQSTGLAAGYLPLQPHNKVQSRPATIDAVSIYYCNYSRGGGGADVRALYKDLGSIPDQVFV